MNLNFEWGYKLPTYFIASARDTDVVVQQMKRRKFNSSLLLGIASRCFYGKPQVILCKSLLNGMPFPTNFWLSCPALVKKAGQLESCGGVKGLEVYIKENSEIDWEPYNRLHARIRINLANKDELDILRRSRSKISLYENFCDDNVGIGGTKVNKKVQVKCLHLQIASFLSLGFHPGQDWLKKNISSFYLNLLDPIRDASAFT